MSGSKKYDSVDILRVESFCIVAITTLHINCFRFPGMSIESLSSSPPAGLQSNISSELRSLSALLVVLVKDTANGERSGAGLTGTSEWAGASGVLELVSGGVVELVKPGVKTVGDHVEVASVVLELASEGIVEVVMPGVKAVGGEAEDIIE